MTGFFKANMEFGMIMLTKFRLVPRLWLIALVIVNMASLVFIDTIEARVVLGAFVISVIMMTETYRPIGFCPLTGNGTHFVGSDGSLALDETGSGLAAR